MKAKCKINGFPIFFTFDDVNSIKIHGKTFSYSRLHGRLEGTQQDLKEILLRFSREELAQLIMDLIVEVE
jgi:hypothetical protein